MLAGCYDIEYQNVYVFTHIHTYNLCHTHMYKHVIFNHIKTYFQIWITQLLSICVLYDSHIHLFMTVKEKKPK